MKLEQKGLEYEDCHDLDKAMGMGLKSFPVMCVDGEILKFEDAVKYVNKL